MNDRSISEALAPRAEMPLSFQKLELPALADSLPFGIYTCDTAGTLIQFNRQCETIWGAKPRPGSEGKFSGGAHRLYDIENRSLAPAETPMAEAVRTGKPAPARELIVERPDQTVPSARSPSEFAASFGGRIQTLARTHSLLTENTWQGAELSALLRDQLIVGESGDDRVSYAGPSVMLNPQAALQPVDALAAALVRRNIPFAFVSGYGREGLPEAFRQAMLIRKPFQHQRLIEAVQQMVQEQGTVVQLRKNF